MDATDQIPTDTDEPTYQSSAECRTGHFPRSNRRK